MSHSAGNGTVTLDDGEREALRKLVDEHGVAGVARMLGLSRSVVTAAAGGIGVRQGSVELVRKALAAHQEKTA